MPITRAQFRSSQQGFTLVELIIGLVVLGLAVVMLAMLFFPQAQRSAEPILQTRAAGLGQALMLEIMSKSFDQHSDRTGGLLRCGETDAPTCTEPTALGPDSGETRALFNDVDDYHGLNSIDDPLSDALGQAISVASHNVAQGFECRPSTDRRQYYNDLKQLRPVLRALHPQSPKTPALW